jgi:hypothetical protein
MATGERLWVLAHAAPLTDAENAQIELIHARAHELLLAEPINSPRALVFADSRDGTAHFLDISLASPLGSELRGH